MCPGDYQRRLLERNQFGQALRKKRTLNLAKERVLKDILAVKIGKMKK
jgi:hypothetical protein